MVVDDGERHGRHGGLGASGGIAEFLEVVGGVAGAQDPERGERVAGVGRWVADVEGDVELDGRVDDGRGFAADFVHGMEDKGEKNGGWVL